MIEQIFITKSKINVKRNAIKCDVTILDMYHEILYFKFFGDCILILTGGILHPSLSFSQVCDLPLVTEKI